MKDLDANNAAVTIGSTHEGGEILYKSKNTATEEKTKQVIYKVENGFLVRM
jgi:hypothetical protein